MDKILINDLRCSCIVGILPEERIAEQEIRIWAELEVDLKKSAETGSIADTVDYYALSEMIIERARNMEAGLLEELGTGICRMICVCFKGVSSVKLRILKPEAVKECAGCGIEITRTAADFGK